MILCLDEINPGDLPLVGGKALNLGRMKQAGLPVPPGFVVTTEAYARRDDPVVAQAIAVSYHELGGIVAVRSSATAEDLDEASFAGQQATILGVSGAAEVLDAVRECWASLLSERAAAYRRAHGIPEEGISTAVVVQRLVEADAAGVLFTRGPAGSDEGQFLVEAAWGLGEAVVSGRVTPDRWRLESSTGRVVSAEIARKRVMRVGGREQPVPEDRQLSPALTDEELQRLAELGRRVEAFFEAPQDIEWAISGGALVVLQSRPITVSGAEREQIRREEIAYLRERAAVGGTVWARYSLAEVLPEPLPMTWSLWKRFMTGGGGYGRMYRELGYDPDPCLDTDGVLDLIAGRPYFNLSRDARLYFRHFPYDYPFEKLKSRPELAIYPQPEANLSRAPKGFLFKLGGVICRMVAAQKRLTRTASELPERLERTVFPRMERQAAELRGTDLAALPDRELLAAFEAARDLVFEEFAPQGLKATVLAGLAIQELESALRPAFGEDAASMREALLQGVEIPPAYDLTGAIWRLSEGTLTQEGFLSAFGHRGPGEMELANPRWRELGLEALAYGGAEAPVGARQVIPLSLTEVVGGSRGVDVRKIERLRDRAFRFTGLREGAKHFLMLGYEVLRLVLLEFDRRYELHGGIFYLESQELPDLLAGRDFRPYIVHRRRRRALALGLEAPRVLFSDDLEALGRAAEPAGAGEVNVGTGVSAGVAVGEALVVRSPAEVPAGVRDFVLVCPSTDPGWVPLFIRARGVVLETGGILSHGAIVARELGLPAVANIQDACARFRTGQRLKVDGSAGKVWIV